MSLGFTEENLRGQEFTHYTTISKVINKKTDISRPDLAYACGATGEVNG